MSGEVVELVYANNGLVYVNGCPCDYALALRAKLLRLNIQEAGFVEQYCPECEENRKFKVVKIGSVVRQICPKCGLTF